MCESHAKAITHPLPPANQPRPQATAALERLTHAGPEQGLSWCEMSVRVSCPHHVPLQPTLNLLAGATK